MYSHKMLTLVVVLLLALFSLSFSQVLLNGAAHPKFVNPLPNPLDPGFIFQPTVPGGTEYEIGMYEIEQNLGLVDPVTLTPLTTTVWGYGTGPGFPNSTFPGRTFEVQSNQQIKVHWTNNLPIRSTGGGHLLPVDVSLHWALSLPGYDISQINTYGVPVVPHVHGGHTESNSDGLPEYWFTPNFALTGPRWVNETYVYDNDQSAGTLWYHDHGLGITRLNVYAGLAGFYIIRDAQDTGESDNPLGLPTDQYEVPLVIQDRLFTADGQLFYPTVPMELEPGFPAPPDPSALPEFFGDFILVNGQAWPFLNVEPRLYRFRLLNGSDSRFYTMWLAGGPQIIVIGTDNELLNAPVAVDKLTIGPGERYDVLVNFAGYENMQLILRNNARSPFPKGATVNPNADGQIMAFNVGTTVTNTNNNIIPTLLGNVTPITGSIRTRKLALFEGIDQYGRLQPMLGVAESTTAVDGTVLNGSLLWDEVHNPITENPALNDTEIWEFYNTTPDAHPVHIHLVKFRVLGRQKVKFAVQEKTMTAHDGSTSIGFEIVPGTLITIGQNKAPSPEEDGYKDTVISYPGEVTRVIAKFDRPGRYVWHCHILSHEDHEMMRPYHVGPVPTSVAEAPIAVASASSEGYEVETVKPEKFALEANFPNPFNPSTEIRFQLPEAGNVELTVFNTLGQEVITLAQGTYEAGVHSVVWNARDKYGNQVPSGLYIYRITAGNFVQERKMMLLK